MKNWVLKVLGIMDYIYEPGRSDWKKVKCPTCGKIIPINKNRKRTSIICYDCRTEFEKPKDGAKIII
jgi:ribosomal protein S27E